MIRRILVTALLTYVLLVFLLWPLGHTSVYLYIERGGSISGITLRDGAIQAIISPWREGKLLERDEVRIGVGRAVSPTPESRSFRIKNTLGVVEINVPLLWPTVVAISILAGSWWYSRFRRRRRLHRHVCIACGFQRSSSEGPCTECGANQAELARGTSLGPIMRDAAIATLLCIDLLTWATVLVWRTDQRLAAQFKARVFDYSWYLQACTPHLSGEVFYAQPGSGPDSLGAVLRRAQPGSTIVLLPGDHVLYDSRRRQGSVKGLRDIWLLGSGRDDCTLSIELEQADRVRIEGVTINCNDTPFIDNRGGMAVHLRECTVINYNSGAGGSNAISASGAALLIENCTFDGTEGRASANMRGDALDLRGNNRVYARGTIFMNNDEIGRNPEMVLDNCRFYSDKQTWPPSTEVLTRNFDAPSSRPMGRPFTGRPFGQAIDDHAPLAAFARTRSLDAWSDPLARDLVAQAGIPNDPDFWRRLLLHPSADIRTLAQEQLRLPEPPQPTGTLESWLQQLDKTPLSPQMTESLLSDSAKSRPLLEAKATLGTRGEQGNAKALLRLMNTQPPFEELVRASPPQAK